MPRFIVFILLAYIYVIFLAFINSPFSLTTRRDDFLGSADGNVLRDLILIKNALSKFYEDNKRYPKSDGYDGLLTCYGRSGEDWIRELTPKYLKVLPRDPRYSTNCYEQYYYYSNGESYKLISHNAQNVRKVLSYYPETFDPVRRYNSYGFWTQNFVSK